MNRKVIIVVTVVLFLTACAATFWFLKEKPSGGTQMVQTASSDTPHTDTTIVTFGDSLTAGYGLPLFEAYPAQLEVALKERGWSVRVINSGVSGETSAGNYERAAFIRNQNADVIILGIGGNDALRFLPLEQTISNIRKTIEMLKGGVNPPTILLLKMQAPANAGAAYKQSFDSMYAKIAEEYGLQLVPFITEEIFLNEAYVLADRIHLNKDGYSAFIEKHLLTAVEDVLAERSNK